MRAKLRTRLVVATVRPQAWRSCPWPDWLLGKGLYARFQYRF